MTTNENELLKGDDSAGEEGKVVGIVRDLFASYIMPRDIPTSKSHRTEIVVKYLICERQIHSDAHLVG